MTLQCRSAGITHPIRFSAVDAKEAAHDTFTRYGPHDPNAPYWEMTPTEIACTESHRAIWEAVAQTGRPSVVLEDDVLLSTTAADVIAGLANHAASFHLVKLDALSFVVRLGPAVSLGQQRLHPLTHPVPSAAAYLLSPAGAAILLSRSQSYCDHLDDFITRPAPGYRAFQLWPAIAVQGMFAALSGEADIPSDVAGSERTTSEQGTVPRPARGPALYRLRKDAIRTGRKLARRLWRDRSLRAAGGTVGVVPLAEDLPPYRSGPGG
ncbi:hypothetical protein GCM10008024_14560 [Allgaiera indica]|nr:hypothetical protein GCM10008024_14560 [Allgaiera indica]